MGDIASILDNYFDIASEDIYDNHNDLFGNRELEEIAAYVIGRKIKYIVGNSSDLKKRLERILSQKRAMIVQRIAVNHSKSELMLSLILENLLTGILEN